MISPLKKKEMAKLLETTIQEHMDIGRLANVIRAFQVGVQLVNVSVYRPTGTGIGMLKQQKPTGIDRYLNFFAIFCFQWVLRSTFGIGFIQTDDEQQKMSEAEDDPNLVDEVSVLKQPTREVVRKVQSGSTEDINQYP